MTLRRSSIGYVDPNDPRPVYEWEPCGYGCSGGCECCWARRNARRQVKNCPRCARFEVHFHPERLLGPSETKKPGIVLTCFHADLFDPQRCGDDIASVRLVTTYPPFHTYVLLTQQPAEMAKWTTGASYTSAWKNCYFGVTIRTQADADTREYMMRFSKGHQWLSAEPLHEDIVLGSDVMGIRGVIVGQDRYKGAPGTETLDHIRSVVRQCQEAHVPVYVKQLWIDGRLCHDPADFPPDLRLRTLPWARKKG